MTVELVGGTEIVGSCEVVENVDLEVVAVELVEF